MHPRMADLAEGNQVVGVIIGTVLIDVMDMQIFIPAADGAVIRITVQYLFSKRFPLL